MDESILWLNRLLKATAEDQLDKDMSKFDFQQLLLYWLATHTVNWSESKWASDPRYRSSTNGHNAIDRAQILMDYCGRTDDLSARHSVIHERLSYLITHTLDKLNFEERLNLFDTLFFRVIAQLDIDRRHAEISAAFANGLARKEGLVELQAYSGEPFIVHFNLDKGGFLYRYTLGKNNLQDLPRLRLVTHHIEAHLINDQPTDFDSDCLTLLDLDSGNEAPFSTLLERLQSKKLTQRTLVLFKPRAGSEPHVLDDIRRRLEYDDLLEAVFEFTSYNSNGKPIRKIAWLLNRQKFHPGETLCINTRSLLESIPNISAEQLAWFASAVCELWASPVKFRIRQFPHTRMGLAQALFSKYFNDDYQNVEGLCVVHASSYVLTTSVIRRLVPAATTIAEKFSPLDKHRVVDALDQAGQDPLCVYIIGDNGAGKSMLLASLAVHLQQRLTVCAAIASGPADRFPLTGNKDIYRYLGDRTKSNYSTKTIERKLLIFLKEAFSLRGRGELFEKILELLGLKGRIYLAPIELFNNPLLPSALVDQVSPLAEALHNSVPIKGMTLALSRKGNSNLAPFGDLSSGEQQVLLLLGKTLASAGPGNVLLIDEPEVSLHVRWQQLLPGCFVLIARELCTRFVIATHSPTLIANAQDAVNDCFLAKNQQLYPIPPAQRHSVETILLEGFETYTPHNREIAERCAALVANAIRAINQSQKVDADLEQQFLDELDKMDNIITSSGNSDNKRYEQDRQLIIQARDAVSETFRFAEEELIG
ncbi:AAA family ATPase [Pseudomonas neustonica]|uniref:AAA family ATPase n=1 Tax=Pseudomonas neustonica TaxID=2487346 RepID=UPI003F454C9E